MFKHVSQLAPMYQYSDRPMAVLQYFPYLLFIDFGILFKKKILNEGAEFIIVVCYVNLMIVNLSLT